MKETVKLAVGQDGVLKETGKKEIDLDKISELQTVNYIPVEGEIVLQPLTQKEVVTGSGLILPANTKELRAAVIRTNPLDTKWKRGEVVRLDGNFFQGGVPVDYIDGKPCLQIPNHFIRGTYPGLDLSGWKVEESKLITG